MVWTAGLTFDDGKEAGRQASWRQWLHTPLSERGWERVQALAVVPAFNKDQTRYLDTLCVLVAGYKKMHRTVGKAKLNPLEVLHEFVAEHRMKVLGVSESAASVILKGDRALKLDHVWKLAERF